MPIYSRQPSLVLTQSMPLTGEMGGLDGPLGTQDWIPLGMIRTTGSTFPIGEAHAYGALLAIADHPELFQMLGTIFGGDGMVTFGTPNMGGRVTFGATTGVNPGDSVGAGTHTFDASHLPTSDGAGAAFDNRQPGAALTWVIDVDGVPPGEWVAGDPNVAGVLMQWAGTGEPDGYMTADGRELDIADWPDLYAAIGTLYGGDGITTFRLPDLRGRIPIGADGDTPVGTVLGEDSVLTIANLPVSAGGEGEPVSNLQPSLAITYLVAVQGAFPAIYGPASPANFTVGEIVAYAGTGIPPGFVAADGQTLLITQNGALYSLYQTAYGGDGATTFGVPNLNGRAVVGAGYSASDGATLERGQVIGSETFTLTAADIPNIDPDFSGVALETTSVAGQFARLDDTVDIRDVNLDGLNGGDGDYSGASLTLQRQDGSNLDDIFAIDGEGASFTVVGYAATGVLQVGGETFAAYTHVSGFLIISFGGDATPTSTLVDEVASRILYSNNVRAPSDTVTLVYRFNDGNAGDQGTGGAQAAQHESEVLFIPAAPSAPDLAAVSDLGSSDSDDLTADDTPTLTGTGPADAEIRIYDGVTLVASGMADGSGDWSITLPAQGAGQHHYVATAVVAGEESVLSDGLTVTIDLAPPTETNLETPDIDEGGAYVLTTADLQFAGPGDVTYTVTSGAVFGVLTLNSVQLLTGDTFTQADIDAGLVAFQHNGAETGNAGFGFTATDAAGNTTGEQTFGFDATPTNDTPTFGGVIHTPWMTFNGDSADDWFGQSVASAGDVNGDGFADLIVAAPGDDNNGSDSGSARVISGVDGATLYTFNGDSAVDGFANSVASAGDVNGDGFADLIVGAPSDDNNGPDSGSARVISGVDGATLYTFNGDSAGDRFGISVASAGDVNGDGFADLIVGAAHDDNNGLSSGSARVISGADGATLHTFSGDSASDWFGWSVASAGDVNGDGFADLIVGADGDDNNGSYSGSARVFSGIDGAILYTFNGDSADDRFGYSVASAGDVNGDGFADLIVGAFGDDNNGFSSGSARVISGVDGATLYTFNGDSANDQFGSSVASAGDVNGDGFADLIVGAYADGNNGFYSGSARVISGADGATLYTFNGDSAEDYFGISVASAGDVNGDGLADLIVGAHADANNDRGSGSARVFLSQRTGLFDAAAAFTEGGAAVVLDSDVLLNDVELDAANNYAGASLTFQRQGGADADDVFSGSGAVTLSGGDVDVSGTVVGTYVQSGGQLVITFNANATSALADQVAQSIAYANTSDGPPASVEIELTFSDGDAVAPQTVTGSVTVDITAVNDAPTVGGDGTESAADIDEDAPSATGQTVADLFGGQFSDAADGAAAASFDGIVVVANGSDATGQWQYWDDGLDVWTDIGARGPTNGLILNAATAVRFNPAPDFHGAAPTLTAHLLESGAITGSTIDLVANPPGGSTVISTGTVVLSQEVLSVNDAPELTGFSVNVAITEGDGPILLDTDVTFTDVEGNFDGGWLDIAGGEMEDVVSIRDQGMGAGEIGYDVDTGEVFYGGVLIGYATGGCGCGPLSVEFNADATAEAIDALIQNLTFEYQGDDPGTSRTLFLSIMDADGATIAGSDRGFEPYDGPNAADIYNIPSLFVSLADFDNDGDLDMGVNDGAGFMLYRNRGDDENPDFTPVSEWQRDGYGRLPVLVDVDGDGRVDLLGVGPGPATFHRKTASGFREADHALLSMLGRGSATAADYDGDGDMDLIVASMIPGDVEFAVGLRLIENEGGGVWTERTGGDNPFADIDGDISVSLGDVDGDGDLDLITAGLDGLRYYRNEGDDTFTELTGFANPLNSLPVPVIALGNLNGDGYADFMAPGGSVTLFGVNVLTGLAPFTVNVTPVNDDPYVENNLGVWLDEGDSIVLDWTEFSFNDYDNELSEVTFTITAAPAHGELRLDGVALGVGDTFTQQDIDDGLLSYHHDGSSTTSDNVQFDVTDGAGGSTNGHSFTFDIDPVEDDPIVRDDAVNASEQTGYSGSVFDDNGSGPDFDEDGPPIEVIAVNGNPADVGTPILLASGALLTLNSDGTFTYDPNGVFDHLTAASTGGANVSAGDSFTYTITGGGTATVFVTIDGEYGGGDLIIGTSGQDSLVGGAGDDILVGWANPDVLDGGDGFDIADYSGSGQGVSVRLYRSSTSSDGHARGDVLSNIEGVIGSAFDDVLAGSEQDDVLEGGAGADTLTGRGGADVLRGGLGADYLHGGSGDDILIGGEDADHLDGGAGFDTVDYSASGKGVTVRLYLGSTASEGHARGDVIANVERVIGSAKDDLLVGSDLADVLEGGAGNDTLVGRAGDDVLIGGAGADILTGAGGADTFVFLGASGVDTVTDFGAGDTLSLDSAVFADFADVMAHATDGPGGVVIAKGAVSITLTGVTVASLSADAFVFSGFSAPPASPLLPLADSKADGLTDFDPLVLPAGLDGKTVDDGLVVCPPADSVEVAVLEVEALGGGLRPVLRVVEEPYAWLV